MVHNNNFPQNSKNYASTSFFSTAWVKLRHIYVLRLLIMLETSSITVIYKRIGKFWYITQSELNSCKWRYFHLKSSRGYLCIWTLKIPSNSIKFAKIWFIVIQVLEFLMVHNYNFPRNSINICFHIIFSHCISKLDVQMYCYTQIIL
jgi:hypothetical protein